MSTGFDPVAVGRRIKAIRGDRPVKSVVAGTSLDYSAWSRYENGRTKRVSVEKLAEVAAAIGASIDTLLGVKNPSGELLIRERAAPPFEDPNVTFAAPLLRIGVAAGEPRLELAPVEPRPYFFRQEWLRRKGWDPEREPDRFAVFRLGDAEIARSMAPTIQPGSVLLVDRKPDRAHVPPRSVWIVRLPVAQGEDPQLPLLPDADPPRFLLTTKRVTIVNDHAVLESDNPDPRYAPLFVRCRQSDRATLLKGRVVWYATDLDSLEEI